MRRFRIGDGGAETGGEVVGDGDMSGEAGEEAAEEATLLGEAGDAGDTGAPARDRAIGPCNIA